MPPVYFEKRLPVLAGPFVTVMSILVSPIFTTDPESLLDLYPREEMEVLDYYVIVFEPRRTLKLVVGSFCNSAQSSHTTPNFWTFA